MVDCNELIKIRNRYDKHLQSSTEANIKTFIVIPLLQLLGFKIEWMDLEGKSDIPRSPKDIVIYVDNDKEKLFFIETKNKDITLSSKDINQLIRYLHEVGIEWGILTNGSEYILLNDTPKLKNIDKQIFIYKLPTINSKDMPNMNILKYFSHDYLFKKKVANYYKYVNLYKHLFLKNNTKQSWIVYNNTLNNFFEYIIENKQKYYISRDSIESITPNEIKDFFDYSTETSKTSSHNRKIISYGAIENKLRHINGFFQTLKKKSIINKNPIENISLDFFTNGTNYKELKCTNRLNSPISNEEVSKMINNCIFKDNQERNKLLLLLLILAGLNRSELNTLQCDNIDSEKYSLILNNRKIPTPKLIISNIDNVININQKKGLKSKYIFTSNYSHNRNNPIDGSQMNSIINEILSKTDIPIERQNEIDINFFKESIIKKMFENGFHIEEITYFTGTSIKSIGKYIDDESIKHRLEKNKNVYNKFIKKHPYKDIFDNIKL